MNHAERFEFMDALNASLARVKARDRAIFMMRHGLDGQPAMTCAEIAAEFGLSGARVKQIVSGVAFRLRCDPAGAAFRKYFWRWREPAPPPLKVRVCSTCGQEWTDRRCGLVIGSRKCGQFLCTACAVRVGDIDCCPSHFNT